MSIQYAGGTNVNATFTGANKADIQSNIMSNLVTAGWSQVTGPALGGSQTVTVTIASPGVVTLTAHGLLANDVIVFATTGALPTGFSAATQYFVKTVLTANTFTLSASSGGAVINTSGTQSGTQSIIATVRMQSAATPWGVSMRLALRDIALTQLCLSIENSNSTVVGGASTNNGALLAPAVSRVWRVIANKYQGFVFVGGTTPVSCWAAFGTPYLPTFLQGVLTECSWLQSNTAAGTDTIIRQSFRTVARITGQCGLYQGITNANLIEGGNGNSGPGNQMLISPSAPAAGFLGASTGTHWHDASAIVYEPLISWANTSSAAEPFIRGQLWDAALICDTFAADTTTTFDTHNWFGITDTDSTEKLTLFVVVP